MANIQLFLSIGIPTLAVLIGFLLNNARLNTIETRIGSVETNLGARISGVESTLGARISGVESSQGTRIDSLESNLVSRLIGVESRLAAIEGDLRQLFFGIWALTRPRSATSKPSAAPSCRR
jgi:hypothetical protein